MKQITIALSILFICSFQPLLATNLRGQILLHTAAGNVPAANTRVDLMIYNPKTASWQDVSYVVTGPDGFYYFLNFYPNQLFYVSIGGKFYPPTQTPLSIVAINPAAPPYYEDIPPIIL